MRLKPEVAKGTTHAKNKTEQEMRKDLVPESLSDRFRRWRRTLKSRMPYVRRREFNIVEQRQARLIEDLNLHSCASHAVALVPLKEDSHGRGEEVCLFVTYAQQPELKRHVIRHIEHLLSAGVQVILIVNTDLAPDTFRIDPSLLHRLRMAYLRANRGFDFAAWSHAWKALSHLPDCKRLYLVNDSIVGPLSTEHFSLLIARVRACNADIVGLTETSIPLHHLQSYFLVIQGKALGSALFQQFFENLLCLPTKETVINMYEIRLTGYLVRSGFTAKALFSGPSGGHTENDTLFHWAELIRAGFPYIKTSVLRKDSDDPRMAELIPDAMRQAAV